ncbi:DUF916 domain-containing protein [Compostimonas suwonensis]|uniref:COG1470 family protein n=1 Tax=Compostimonas suwonensis TaxID=1048394 RepID=UPI0012FE2B31|nr:DUF916 domain-containing protein [Compostimonas suwonensis]
MLKRRSALAAVTALGFSLAVGLLAASPAQAADDDISWAVQPSSATGPDGRDTLSYQLAPGESVTDYVGVSNLSAAPLQMRVYAMDALMTSDGAFTLPPADTKSVDVGSWVGITGGEGTYTIEPGTRIDIPFRLTVPPTASPGDHAGGIVASLSEMPSTGDGAQQLAVDRRVGVRIYVDVPGERTPQLAVSDVTVNYGGGWDLFSGTTEVSYTVTNPGNVRLGGTVDLNLDGIGGWDLGTAPSKQLPELLPGSSIEVHETMDNVVPAVLLTATTNLTPTSVGDAGEDVGDPSTASGTGWAIPYLLLIIVIVIAGLIVLLWLRGRHWRRRAALAVASAAGAGEAASGGGATGAPLAPGAPAASGAVVAKAD